jgi:hypothetical protein
MALVFIGRSDINPNYFLAESNYDSFLFFKKKNSSKDKGERKEKRKAFWQNLGKNFEEGGGAEGFGRTVDNVLSLFRKNEPQNNYDYSYEIAPEETPKVNNSSSTLIVGSILVVSFAALTYLALKKKNA